MRKLSIVTILLITALVCGGWFRHGQGTGGIVLPVTNSWANINLIGGGLTTGIIISPTTGIKFARTDTAGAFIWNTTTNRWWQLDNEENLPGCPASGTTLSSGFYPCTGTTRQQNAAGVIDIAGCWANGSVAYMFLAGHVLVSTTISASNPASIRFTDANGSTFPTINDTAGGTFRGAGPKMAVDPYNCDHVLVGTWTAGLWETLNGTNPGGATWTQVPSGSIPTATTSQAGYTIAFDSTGASTGGIANKAYVGSAGNVGLYITTNMGASGSAAAATWAVVGGGGPTGNNFKNLIVNPATIGAGDVWLVDGATSIVWNLSGGVWTNELSSSDPPREVAVNPLNGNHVAVLAGSSNLFINTNGKAGPFTKFGLGGVTSTEAPWLQTYGGIAFPTGTQLAFDPLSSGGDQIIAGVGQSVNTINFNSVGAGFFWQTKMAGIDNLVSRGVIAPKTNFVVGNNEDEGVFQMTPTPVPTAAVQYGVGQAHSLSGAYGLAVSVTDPNLMLTSVSGSITQSVFPDYSGTSTDGFVSNYVPFSSWHANVTGPNVGSDTTSPCSGGSPCVKLTLPGGTTSAGLVSWSPGTRLNSILCSTLLNLPTVGVAATTLNSGNCFTIRLNIDGTITLLNTVYSSTMSTSGYKYIFWNPASAVSNQWNSLTVFNVDSDAGAVRITSSLKPNQILQPICINGVVMTGATVVNGCWVASVLGSSTYDLQGSTFVGGDSYVTGGYATTLPVVGAPISASGSFYIRVGNNNDYPVCSADNGSTWNYLQFPPNLPKLTVDNNGPYTGTSFVIGTGTGSGTGVFLVQLTSGRWLRTNSLNFGGPGTTINFTPGTPPGDSIPSGAIITSGGTGWGFFANQNNPLLAADWVTPNTFYGYNANYGLYKWTGCGATTTTPDGQTISVPGGGTNPVLVAANNGGFSSNAVFSSVLKTVPGQAGHLFFTVGAILCGNNCHPQNTRLWRSCSGQSNSAVDMTFAVGGFFEPNAVGFGANKLGSSYATEFVAGFYDPSGAGTNGGGVLGNSIFGIWRSTDDPNNGRNGSCLTGGTWQKLGNQMIHATGSWTTSTPTIAVDSCANIVPGMSVYSNSKGALIGRVATCVSTTMTLAANAAAASQGSADQIAVGDLPVGWPVIFVQDITGDPGDYTRVYLAGNGTSFFFGSFNFLLKRDLDPASNDNNPVGVNRAA